MPQLAVDMILRAEEWEGKPEGFMIPPQWETLAAKFGKELKRIAKEPTVARQISTMEDKSLRKYRKQLSGMAIYIMIFRSFERDAKLGKPQALEELQTVTYETNVKGFISKWDQAMERFISAGDLTSGDDALLYCLFKKQFLKAPELKDHHAQFQRARSDSKVHSMNV